MFGRLMRRLREAYLIKADPVRYARHIGVRCASDARLIDARRGMFGSEPFLVSIGSGVTVAGQVAFITHDGGVDLFRGEHPRLDVVGRIDILDQCFVGYRAILLPGVRIGPNSVVAAGSVVTRDVPPGTVVAGVPARAIASIDDYKRRALSKGIHVRGEEPEVWRAAILAHLEPSQESSE